MAADNSTRFVRETRLQKPIWGYNRGHFSAASPATCPHISDRDQLCLRI
jgi:hypothetical protein